MRLNAVKQLFDVNVFGLMLTTKYAVPLLRVSQGRIVNIGSLGGMFAHKQHRKTKMKNENRNRQTQIQ